MKKDLNLASTYVPNWGAYSVVRELLSNAKDAGPYEMRLTDNRLVIESASFPALSEMLIMGHGSKTNDGRTIGCFGEGLKLSALTAARKDWPLVFKGPMGTVTFAFMRSKGMDVDTLHANIDPGGKIPGFYARFVCPALKAQLEGKLLAPDALIGRVREIPKDRDRATVELFHQGMFVCELPGKGLYDWNVENITLNRDRTIPDIWNVQRQIGMLVASAMEHDEAFRDLLVLSPGSYEVECLNTQYISPGRQQLRAASIRKRFGEKCVYSSGDSTQDKIAERLGYTVLSNYDKLAGSTGDQIKHTSDVTTIFDGLTPLNFNPPQEVLDEFNKIMDLLAIPARLVIFGSEDKVQGLAKTNGQLVEVWLNETLFLPGMRLQRLSTLCHELGHIQKGAGDGTLEFERSLGQIAGGLAIAWLDKK